MKNTKLISAALGAVVTVAVVGLAACTPKKPSANMQDSMSGSMNDSMAGTKSGKMTGGMTDSKMMSDGKMTAELKMTGDNAK